jgi:hypothetical protein
LLAFPAVTQTIKKELSVAALQGLCEESRRAGTTAAAFAARSDKPVALVKTWLETWCEFKNVAQMFECLQNLEIECFGSEVDIERNIDRELGNWFQTPDLVRQKIRQFIEDNASTMGSLTPRMVAVHIDAFLIPAKRTWARYRMHNALHWHVAGTLSGHDAHIEPPANVVDKLWTSGGKQFELQLEFDCPQGGLGQSSLTLSLARLALHAKTGVSVAVKGRSGWEVAVANATRQTLGSAETELEDLGWLECSPSPNPIEHRKLDTLELVLREHEEFAERMNCVTWNLVKSRVASKIGVELTGEIQGAVAVLWDAWDEEVSADPVLQAKLISEMLHAASEGTGPIGTLRSGPRTVVLVASGIIMLLCVAAAWQSPDARLDRLDTKLAVRAVALRFWSGPAGSNLGVRTLLTGDDAGDRFAFLGKETVPVLILSAVTAGSSEVFGATLADGLAGSDSFLQPRRPRVVITSETRFNEALRSGSLVTLGNFLKEKLGRHALARAANIEQVATNR